jgi:hypothetical protein
VITQRRVCFTLFALAASSALTHPAAAQSDTCAAGYVWREAFVGDHVCVSPDTRELARTDNANSEQFRAKQGSDECIQGFVWRLANPDDHVCVPQITSEETARDNQLAYSRLASGPPEGFRLRQQQAIPPAKVGCHVFKAGQWQEVRCATPEETSRVPPPSSLYIKNSPHLIPPRFNAYTLPLELGEIDIELKSDPALGTVFDVALKVFNPTTNTCERVTTPARVPDSFSIQLNTNFFKAKNGSTGWVQFVHTAGFNPANRNSEIFCVWQVDVEKQVYIKECTPTYQRSSTLFGPNGTRNEIAAVKGVIRKDQSGKTQLTAWAQLPWLFPNYAIAITTTSGDIFGLEGKWFEVSGDIYGMGCYSTAEFTGARFSQRIIASTCTLFPYCSSLTPMTKYSLPHFAAPAVNLMSRANTTTCCVRCRRLPLCLATPQTHSIAPTLRYASS